MLITVVSLASYPFYRVYKKVMNKKTKIIYTKASYTIKNNSHFAIFEKMMHLTHTQLLHALWYTDILHRNTQKETKQTVKLYKSVVFFTVTKTRFFALTLVVQSGNKQKIAIEKNFHHVAYIYTQIWLFWSAHNNNSWVHL